jgi:hypothetical protein
MIAIERSQTQLFLTLNNCMTAEALEILNYFFVTNCCYSEHPFNGRYLHHILLIVIPG